MDTHLITRTLIVAKVREALVQARENFHRADKLVAAISGGSDSTALLVALCAISKEVNFSVVACHINHKLRGGESDQDEQYCLSICQHLNVECRVYRAPVTSTPSEANLRATRYGFLGQCAEAVGSTMILTAHTQDDQVETVLFRLFRGTSASGFTGIKPVRKLDNGLILVRPMLNNTRKEVSELLSTIGIVARADSSNMQTKFARNFLRQGLIPLCQQRFSSMSTQIERFRNIVACEDDYLGAQTDPLFEKLNTEDANVWLISALNREHAALKRRCIARALEERQIEPSFERVEAILDMVASGKPYARLSLGKLWDVKISHGHLLWMSKTVKTNTPMDIELLLPGQTDVPNSRVILIEPWQLPAPVDYPHRQAAQVFVNLASISPPIRYRQPTPGDKIQPLGMSQPVALKQFLRTHKPAGDFTPRDGVHLIADRQEVLWVPGYGMSDKLKVLDLPTHRICIQEAGIEDS